MFITWLYNNNNKCNTFNMHISFTYAHMCKDIAVDSSALEN